MKKLLTLLLIAMLALSSVFAQAASEKSATVEKTELIVFAAASMKETLTQIKAVYEEANPNITLTFNFDSSGTLKTQIEQGADCDVFLSAATKQMNQLTDLNMVDTSTRLDLLENKTALAVPEGNPKNITSFDELATLLREGKVLLAIGNSDVPVGQYTQKIFAYYGLDEAAIASSLTYGTNVKEVTTQVSQNSVDCGIIYATDAFSAGLEVVDTATSDMTGGKVIYPVAVLSVSRHPVEAASFVDYLTTDEAMAVFSSVGFASAL